MRNYIALRDLFYTFEKEKNDLIIIYFPKIM